MHGKEWLSNSVKFYVVLHISGLAEELLARSSVHDEQHVIFKIFVMIRSSLLCITVTRNDFQNVAHKSELKFLVI